MVFALKNTTDHNRPTYVKSLNVGFHLGTLDEAIKFSSIPELLQFVSKWGADPYRGAADIYSSAPRASDKQCGFYTIVKIEQQGWREVGIVA